MEKHLELVWKKIDGSLSKDEAIIFNELSHNDKSFVNLSAHLIHLLPVPTFLAAAPLVQRAGQLQ